MSWRASIRARLGEFVLDVELEGDTRPVAVVGPNGSGKTTLLRALAGAVPAERAEVVVGARVLASTTRRILKPMEERRVGYVPQGYGLFPHLRVLGNVAFGLTGSGLAKGDRLRRARAILEDLNCAALAYRKVHSLSGGEQQRVALARALVVDPLLLLLDEPMAALDVGTRRGVRGFLRDRLKGRPALMATHDVRDAVALEAEIYVLHEGRVAQRGRVDALRAAPANEFVAEFVGA
ncbi:MAG: ABC transporter ATP-binding protein [Myxococcota bacterium]